MSLIILSYGAISIDIMRRVRRKKTAKDHEMRKFYAKFEILALLLKSSRMHRAASGEKLIERKSHPPVRAPFSRKLH